MVHNVPNICLKKGHRGILSMYTIFRETIDSFWFYVKQAKAQGLNTWMSSFVWARECSNQKISSKQVFTCGLLGILVLCGAVAFRRQQWHVERLVGAFRSFSLFGTLRRQAQRLGRGLEFVYLHYIYRPLLFAPRVAEIHECVILSFVSKSVEKSDSSRCRRG